jgi:hypothetical protein
MDTQEMEAPAVPLAECGQFICFLDTGHTGDEEQDRYPVGYGSTRADAMGMAFRNAMPHLAEAGVYAMAQTGFVTIAQPNLSAADFAEVAKVIDDFFAGKLKMVKTVERVEPE